MGEAMGKSYTAAESARAAGLRYVSDRVAGIERHQSARGFRYISPTGASVHDRATLERIVAARDEALSRHHWRACSDGLDSRGRGKVPRAVSSLDPGSLAPRLSDPPAAWRVA